MNAVEDRMRDAFAHVVVPDVPVPAIEALQRRAKRHRLNQASGALGSMVVVVMCIFGGMTFGGGSINPSYSNGISKIKAHISGVRGPQWLVAKQTLDGTTYTAASTTVGDGSCVQTSDGFGACDVSDGDWFYNEIGDFGSGGEGDTRDYAGRVPLDAAQVSVTYDGHTVTAPAMRTPTTDRERFFATFFKNVGLQVPIVGVVDNAGQPIAAPGGAPAQRIARQHSSVAGLPRQQYALQSGKSGWGLNGYQQDGKTCLSLRQKSGSPQAPICVGSDPVPSKAIPLTELQLANGDTVVAGDAPAGFTGVALSRGTFENQVPTVALPGDSTHVYWAMTVPTAQMSEPWLIASCSAGWNCYQVRNLDLAAAA